MSKNVLGLVYIKSSCVTLLKENLDRIAVLFSADLCEKSVQEQYKDGISSLEVTAPVTLERSPDFLNRLQVSFFNLFFTLNLKWHIVENIA